MRFNKKNQISLGGKAEVNCLTAATPTRQQQLHSFIMLKVLH